MEERRARVAAGSPVRTTVAWVHAVTDKHCLELAWPLTDPPLRLALVQRWILDNGRRFCAGRQRDGLAAGLAVEHPTDPVWPRFARWRVRRWVSSWGDLGVCPRWGVLSRPEPVGLDLEEVTLVRYEDGEPLGEAIAVEAGAPRVALRFVMRVVDGRKWRVAGFSGRLPVPGWPPTEIEIERASRQC